MTTEKTALTCNQFEALDFKATVTLAPQAKACYPMHGDVILTCGGIHYKGQWETSTGGQYILPPRTFTTNFELVDAEYPSEVCERKMAFTDWAYKAIKAMEKALNEA